MTRQDVLSVLGPVDDVTNSRDYRVRCLYQGVEGGMGLGLW